MLLFTLHFVEKIHDRLSRPNGVTAFAWSRPGYRDSVWYARYQMKHVHTKATRTAIIVIALIFGCSATLWSQTVAIRVWELQVHSQDIEEATVEISQWVEAGYLPVGLEHAPGRPVMVMYTQNINTPISEVSLHTITDMNGLGGEMNALLEAGYVPMGMASHADGVTLLLVRTEIPVLDWGLATTRFNLQSISMEIRRRAIQGFSAWAISNHGDQAWLLFLREADAAPDRQLSVQSYVFNPDNYVPGIDSATSNLLFPWGITTTEEEFLVLYTQTQD